MPEKFTVNQKVFVVGIGLASFSAGLLIGVFLLKEVIKITKS